MEEKNDVIDNGGWIFDDDGWGMATVFDFNDGDNDVRPERLDLFGLEVDPSMIVEEERFASIIFLTVTFLFFFDGDDMVVQRASRY